MSDKKILITCFEPFGQNAKNTSCEAVMRMGDIAGAKVEKVCLPVTWNGAPKILFSKMDEFAPDLVLMTGLASGADHIRIERVGINLCGAIRDNDGLLPSDKGERKIVEDGECAFFSTFDHENILASLKSEGIRSAYSFSAGTYICNLVLYGALKKINDERLDSKAGFIHVPDAEEIVPEGKPSMALETITRAVMIAAGKM